MKITTQTRYGMRFLLEIALHESGPAPTAKITTQQIAQKQGISEKYLEAIAAKLKKGGLICSAKGVNGGYWLAKPMNEITLGDVMRLMETTYFDVHCGKHGEHSEDCPNQENCALAKFWVSLEGAISELVDSLSLEDINDQFNMPVSS
jgi:Rrf2 family protein